MEEVIQNIQRNRLETERARNERMQEDNSNNSDSNSDSREDRHNDEHNDEHNDDHNDDHSEENGDTHNDDTHDNGTTREEHTESHSRTNNEDTSSRERRESRYSVQNVAEAIEDAVISVRVENRFAESAKALNKIKDATSINKRLDGEVVEYCHKCGCVKKGVYCSNCGTKLE